MTEETYCSHSGRLQSPSFSITTCFSFTTVGNGANGAALTPAEAETPGSCACLLVVV